MSTLEAFYEKLFEDYSEIEYTLNNILPTFSEEEALPI